MTAQKAAYPQPALLTLPGGGAAVDAGEGGGGQPAQQPGGEPGQLDDQAGVAGGRAGDEHRDDHGGGDDRAQQSHRADLPRRAQVAGQHRGQHHAVDDHCLG
jgi:hypothetical protein